MSRRKLPTGPINFVTGASVQQPGVLRVLTSTESARLTRTAIASTCTNNKECPGPFPVGPCAFSSFTFSNPTPRKKTCITVTLRSFNDAGAPVMSHAHANRYDPKNVCKGYLGDAGTNAPTRMYQFILPKRTRKFVIVVENVNPNDDFGMGNFSLSATTPPITTQPVAGGPADVSLT